MEIGKWRKLFQNRENPVMIHVCDFSQFNEIEMDLNHPNYGENKLNLQIEYLKSLFNDPDYLSTDALIWMKLQRFHFI
jgi:hypothetical protein